MSINVNIYNAFKSAIDSLGETELNIVNNKINEVLKINIGMMHSTLGKEKIMEIVYSENEKEQTVFLNFIFSLLYNLYTEGIYHELTNMIENTYTGIIKKSNLDENLLQIMDGEYDKENAVLNVIYIIKYNKDILNKL